MKVDYVIIFCFLFREIHASNHTKIKGRLILLQNEEALDCIFKVLRTGMQWRAVSYATSADAFNSGQTRMFLEMHTKKHS